MRCGIAGRVAVVLVAGSGRGDERAGMERLLPAGVDGMFMDRPALLAEMRGVTRPSDDVPRVRRPATPARDAP